MEYASLDLSRISLNIFSLQVLSPPVAVASHVAPAQISTRFAHRTFADNCLPKPLFCAMAGMIQLRESAKARRVATLQYIATEDWLNNELNLEKVQNEKWTKDPAFLYKESYGSRKKEAVLYCGPWSGDTERTSTWKLKSVVMGDISIEPTLIYRLEVVPLSRGGSGF